jgi:uncharacterized membrane protein YccC
VSDGTSDGDFLGPTRVHPLRDWHPALLTAVGMSAAVGLVALVDPYPGPLVLAAALSMSLARNRLTTTWRRRAEAALLLPFIAVATAGVGYLLLDIPLLGGAAFVIALFLSIWLRRFGPIWSRVGSLVALPFITLLIAPARGQGISWWGAALISLVALLIVVGLRVLAEATHFIPRAALEPTEKWVRQPSNLRPVPSTRMAIQMAIALTAAFLVGWFVFPGHVTWVVLTAFLVNSGNRGRADVVYKSGLRVVGAAVGTVTASIGLAVLGHGHPFLQGPSLVILLLVILTLGLWLREWTYAIWALAMTLVITLLQGAVFPVTGSGILWERIVAIIVGALLGVASAWFVLPIRSEGVVRRRVSIALAALWEFVEAPSEETNEDVGTALTGLDEVAKPWAAWEFATGWRKTHRKPGTWMNLVHECAALIREQPKVSSKARRALADARRSARDPLALGPALLSLRDELEGQR